MPKITAFIHTQNDARRVGRLLDSLRPCDEVLVIDHDSTDDTQKIAREHGATVKPAILGVEGGVYIIDAAHDWIFCVLPSESLSEGLEAALHEWKEHDPPDTAIGYACNLREQNETGWHALGPRMRLVNRQRVNWTGALPPNAGNAKLIPGDLLRFKDE
jgi:glycosyltransferase involved in cell wall biosynthesis